MCIDNAETHWKTLCLDIHKYDTKLNYVIEILDGYVCNVEMYRLIFTKFINLVWEQ